MRLLAIIRYSYHKYDISVSKWPIVSQDERLFNVTDDVGGMSIPRGVLYTAVEKTGSDGSDKTYHVFNTHFAVSHVMLKISFTVCTLQNTSTPEPLS